MQSLIERVSHNDPECTKIATQEFGRNASDDELIRLIKALKRNRFVQGIDFYAARRTTKLFRELAALLRVNTVIHRVALPGGTSNEELMSIEESLCNNTFVTTLDLVGCDIQGRQGGETIRTLLSSNGTIIEIWLDGNIHFGVEGVAGLAQVLQDKRCVLKKLNLRACRIGNDSAIELSTALTNNKVVEVLRVCNNKITFVGFRHIVEMLTTTKSCLKVLRLGGNPLNQDQTGHGTAGDLLSRVFQRNTSLRELHFDWYEGVLAREVRGIVEGLRNNKSLLSVRAWHIIELPGTISRELWHTWSEFVTNRNKMIPLLEGSGKEEASGGCPVHPVPQSLLPHLFKWCSTRSPFYNESPEAQASLIHHALCARSNDICEWVTTTTKRPVLEG